MLDGKLESKSDESDVETQMTAAERTAAKLRHKKRHVWIVDGDKLKAVEIEVGIDDYKRTEIVSGALEAGDKVVIGEKTD